jgi:LysM repeat protein
MMKENPEMKAFSKTFLLVALALVLVLTACERSASVPPAVVPTNSGEVDFPFETQDPVSAAATQTAVASQPLPEQPTDVPQVIVATNTPEGEAPAPEGEVAPTAQAPAPDTTVPNALPTPVIERPQTYTLKDGEWPICIARRYDLDLDSFFKLNGINMNSKPAAGVTLKIPATGTWSAASYGQRSLKQHPVQHAVVAGQSVYSIACAYGDVAPEAILAANGLASPADVKAGTTINIP